MYWNLISVDSSLKSRLLRSDITVARSDHLKELRKAGYTEISRKYNLLGWQPYPKTISTASQSNLGNQSNIHTLRFYLCVRPCVCLCVTDVGVAVTDLRVVCKIITCVSAFTFTELEMAILEIVKTAAKLLLQVWILCVAGYAKDAIVGAYHRTSDGQEHKVIWRAGLERDTIFQLTCHSVQRARQLLSGLAWVASRWQGTSCSSSFVSKVLGASYKRANNFHPVADKFAMCTDRK